MSDPSSAQSTNRNFEVTKTEEASITRIFHGLEYLDVSPSHRKSMQKTLEDLGKGSMPHFHQQDDDSCLCGITCFSSGSHENLLPTPPQLQALSLSRPETTQDVSTVRKVIERLNRRIIMEARSKEDIDRPNAHLTNHQVRVERSRIGSEQGELQRERKMEYSKRIASGEPTITVEQPAATKAGRDWAFPHNVLVNDIHP